MGGTGKAGLKKLSDVNLTLFFTGSVGLKTWAEVGNLDREIVIYNKLTEHLNSVNFISYGGKEDIGYSDRLGKIDVFPVSWSRFTSKNILRLLCCHWTMIKKTDILKTNQIQGSEIPVWLKKRFGKKLIVRCGYLHSRFSELQADREAVIAARDMERKAFEAADLGIVTTERDMQSVINTHGINREKLRVIANYVDVETFVPSKEKKPVQFELIFVGRSGFQKNLLSLLKSLAILKAQGHYIRLLLIGGCAKDEELKRIAETEQLDITFIENVPNSELPQYFYQTSVFILPSLYEGNPKVLLEAMSCAMACIGTDVEGISNLIRHKDTGYLCKTDAQSIADAIKTVLSDVSLRKKMGENARYYVVENYSLEQALKMELDVIRDVIAT